MADEIEYKSPFIGTQFEKFAMLVNNGRSAEDLIKRDPQLYIQISQAFAAAFLLGYRFGEHIGSSEPAEVREEIALDLHNEAAHLSKVSREVAVILGVRTRNTREMRS